MTARLFTPRFFIMCAYTFTVFTSAFQLLPTAPYRILELGGSTLAAGLFLGLLTYASALSAPLTGHLGDRVGQRRVLMSVSLVLAGCTASYAVIRDYRLMLAMVIVHGLFWSALLSASGAYMAATVPASRRGEGLGYWGLASVLAIAVAPPLGFWVYKQGWVTLCSELVALNLLMAVIAWWLPEEEAPEASEAEAGAAVGERSLVEWRVIALSVGLALVPFGYGGLSSFSALFADALHVAPRSLFLTLMATAILAGRVTLGRRLDQIGHRRILLPALVVPAVGLTVLAMARGAVGFLAAAVIFGAGFGLIYPAFSAYVLTHVPARRRGAAFGAIIAAFDTGIGTGSSVIGGLIGRYGFRAAFGVAAVLAVLSAPYFVLAERRLGFLRPAVLGT
jgi:MFS family permease